MVDVLFNMGDDALQNLFDISIGNLPGFQPLSSLVFRVQNLNIPGRGHNTYEVPYKTITIEKPAGKIENPREFTFQLRVDRNWTIYKYFTQWKAKIANPVTGVVGADSPLENYRVDMTAWAIQSDWNPLPNFGSWIMKGCWPKQIPDVSFDYNAGDPILVDITMGCLVIDDTFSTVLTNPAS